MSGMKTERIDIGCSPYGEDCAQVGEPNFRKRASMEMDALINQMRRENPDIENHNVILKKEWYPHDFGTYGSVVAEYLDDDNDARNFAIELESRIPEFWDSEARIELGLDGDN